MVSSLTIVVKAHVSLTCFLQHCRPVAAAMTWTSLSRHEAWFLCPLAQGVFWHHESCLKQLEYFPLPPRGLHHPIIYPSSVTHHPSSVLQHPSSIIYHLSSIIYYSSSIMYHPSSIMYHPLSIIYNLSSIIYNVLFIIYHVLSIIYHV